MLLDVIYIELRLWLDMTTFSVYLSGLDTNIYALMLHFNRARMHTFTWKIRRKACMAPPGYLAEQLRQIYSIHAYQMWM